MFRLVPRNRLVEGTYKNDFNTGFTAKKILSANSSGSKESPQPNGKDNTMILLKNRKEDEDDDRRFKTMMNPKSTYVAAEFTPKKWLQESQLIESDEEDEPAEERRLPQMN